MPPKQVDISTFEPRQLQGVQESLENEINNLAQSSMALQKAAGEYGNSGRALEQLAEQKEGVLYLCPMESKPAVSNSSMILQPSLYSTPISRTLLLDLSHDIQLKLAM